MPRRSRKAEVLNTTEVDELSEAAETSPLAESAPAAASARDMDFFDYLDSLSEADWEDLMVYIYRQEPAVRNAGDGHYIEKVPHAIDEEYIKSKHRGGRYLVFLKNIRTKERVRSKSFVIDGPPKLLEGQTLIDPRTKEPIPLPTAAQASAPTMNEHTIADVLTKAISAVTQQKVPADDAIRSAMETLSQAQKGAMDIVLNAAKSQAASTTGHPMMDKLLERALERMVNGESEKKSPIADLKEMLGTVRELQGLTGEGTSRRGGILEEARAFAEILKTDSDGTIKSLLLGRSEEEPASAMGQLFGFLGKAIERRPDIIDSVASGLARLVQAPATTQVVRRVVLPPAATLADAQPGLQTQPATSAAPPDPQAMNSTSQPQTTEQDVVNAILQTIVNAFQAEYSGKATADSIAVLFPQAVPMLKQYLDYPDQMIGMWLRQQAVMAPILSNPEFPDFFVEFKQALLHPGAEDESEIGEGEQGKGAAAGS